MYDTYTAHGKACAFFKLIYARIVRLSFIYRVFDNPVNNFYGQLKRTKLRRKVL